MSKKKDKAASNEPPIDYQIESKNLQYTITLRELEIEDLKKDNQNKANYLTNLEGDIKDLRNACINQYKIDQELKVYKAKTESLQREVDKLNEDIINNQKKFDEEKRQIENNHQNEVNQLKLTIDAYSQKVEMANQLLIDKENLLKEVEQLKKEKEEIIFINQESMRQKEIKNEIKFSNLKKKMMDNINKTQSKVTELNIQYMDVSTKLTLLQNHQLLIQLEYQSQQIDELSSKKDALEKKVFELNRDIDIHKEVELSLAEKNKKLSAENIKLKNKKIENEKNENNESRSIQNSSVNINNMSLGFDENNSINTNYNRLKAFEKKVIQLEKKLSQKTKDYNNLKDNYEYLETKLKNYEKKYAGLFNFFEESLKLFFEDEEIKNNKEIYVNIEALQKCDFNVFTNEEKYSILVILMKYLLPLINSSEYGNMGNVNLKFHTNTNKKFIEEMENKKYNVNNPSNKNIKKKKQQLNYSQTSVESLPTINNNKSLSINVNNPSGMIYENESK